MGSSHLALIGNLHFTIARTKVRNLRKSLALEESKIQQMKRLTNLLFLTKMMMLYSVMSTCKTNQMEVLRVYQMMMISMMLKIILRKMLESLNLIFRCNNLIMQSSLTNTTLTCKIPKILMNSKIMVVNIIIQVT